MRACCSCRSSAPSITRTLPTPIAKPGHVPQNALAACIVAYGLLIEGANHRLAIAANWFPYKLDATTDETRIGTYLSDSEAVSIASYVELISLA